MCSGGWPQDAFEYVIEHGGVPLRSDMSYNANYLVQITDAYLGQSDEIGYVTLFITLFDDIGMPFLKRPIVSFFG
jgi:Papain family cysteine protease